MSPLFWVGVLAFSGAVSGIVALFITLRTGSLADLTTKVRAMDRDIIDIDDRIEKWRGRDATRRMRAGQLEAAQVQVPQRGTAEYKMLLRQRMRGREQAS